MSPATTVDDLCHLVVASVAIRYQASCKTLEEALRTLSTPVRLVLKDPDMVLAVLSAGIEPHPGFRSGRLKEDGFAVGENFWCKVAFENDNPTAVIAFCQHEQKIVIMEIVVAPELRGQGIGTRLLRELLESDEIIGFTIQKSEAVIFPTNTASQKAFENAGFQYHHTHEDGNSMLYVYDCGSLK